MAHRVEYIPIKLMCLGQSQSRSRPTFWTGKYITSQRSLTIAMASQVSFRMNSPIRFPGVRQAPRLHPRQPQLPHPRPRLHQQRQPQQRSRSHQHQCPHLPLLQHQLLPLPRLLMPATPSMMDQLLISILEPWSRGRHGPLQVRGRERF